MRTFFAVVSAACVGQQAVGFAPPSAPLRRFGTLSTFSRTGAEPAGRTREEAEAARAGYRREKAASWGTPTRHRDDISGLSRQGGEAPEIVKQMEKLKAEQAEGEMDKPIAGELDDLMNYPSQMVDLEKMDVEARISMIQADADYFAKRAGWKADEDGQTDLEARETSWSGQAGMDEVENFDGAWAALPKRKLLLAGDLLALYLFAFIGRASHGEDVSGGLLNLEVWQTAAPFIAGWLALAPPLGAFTRGSTMTVQMAAMEGAKAAALSMPLGVCIRAGLKGELPPPVFVGVSILTTFTFLVGWRALYTKIRGQEDEDGNREENLVDTVKMVLTLIKRW
uniref:Uncharacterized protein n=1 Tax=Chromera velia CCMP2878 TaxID=1169474 RepID=A0A0G4HX28_9ALVE|mmetsp:Transcript_9935/g.19272  ORF Transcript_9935/g.19272 Transcript_9935/m.19272 type:complete len:339 (+) Transcript_9935:185-1201(+)|eukprot:Cvel_32972.t1-p1 / transcript=Cvel_32972.t1 / gene=Cvel_32972 / organism=Chromera_velia_CCMP2878 / gene_product=hypothetical protein / transcript_product=hypothetical protein / location=Cvel_scaffold5240:1369-4257(+) / protein_length=338 / sequence_SO=supercontig / SO=protein_coding / is_pseudo=false